MRWNADHQALADERKPRCIACGVVISQSMKPSMALIMDKGMICFDCQESIVERWEE